jgi:hypothetical protein
VNSPAESGRLLCPRCGERIPTPTREQIQTPASAASSPSPAPREIPPDVPIPRRFSNRAIVLTILTIMVTMGLIGLKLAWETVELRRANDLGLTKPQLFGIPPLIKVFAGLWMVGLVMLLTGIWGKRESDHAPASPKARWLYALGISLAVLSTMVILFSGPIRRRSSQLPPELDMAPVRSVDGTRLEGLRYLPTDTNMILGVHVGELLQDKNSREFLDGLKLATLHFNAERLENWTGLKRDEIEYVVVGLKIEDQIMPRTTIIVRSLMPIDPERLREKLKGVPPADGAPGRFRFRVAGTALDAEAKCIPEDRILILGLTRGDLDAVPAQPHAGLSALSPHLGTLLGERADKRARAWVVGQVSDWDRTPAAWWLGKRPEKERATLKKVRGFASWLTFEDANVLVRAEFESEDAQGATDLAAYLEAIRPEDRPIFKVPTPVDTWVSLQGRMKAQAVQDSLQLK